MQLKSKTFSHLLPSLESVLTCGWEKADPDSLLLLLTASSSHPSILDKGFLKAHWSCKHLLRKEAHQNAALDLLERSFEGREGALAAPHPLGGALARTLLSDPSSLAPMWRAALQRGSQDRPTKAAVIKAKAALLLLFCELLLASAEDPEALVALTTEGAPVALLQKQLSRSNLTLHALAAQFASVKFPAWCERASPESLASAFTLLTSAAPDFDRELPPALRMVHPLMGRVGREALAGYGAALRRAFDDPAAPQAFLANQMRLLIVTGEDLSDTDIQVGYIFGAATDFATASCY